MKSLKWILTAVAGVFLLAVIAIGVLLFTVDPNSFKPELQKQLAKQNLYLDLQGDISWQFFPSIGLQIQDAKLVDTPTPDAEKLVVLDNMAFGLQLAPLFSGSIQVDSVIVEGVTLNYSVYKDGSTNWDAIIAAEPAAEPVEEESTGSASTPLVNVSEIRIQNIVVNYRDEITATDAKAELALLKLLDVNLSGKPFSLEMIANAALTDMPNISLTTNTTIAFDGDAQSLSISDAKTLIQIGEDGQIELNTTADVNLAPLKVTADISLESSTVRALAKAFDVVFEDGVIQANALQSFAFKTDLAMDETLLSLSNTVVSVDQTQFVGETALTLHEAGMPSVVSNWSSELIDTNAFLVTPEEDPEAEAEVAEEEVLEVEPVPLPFPLLRELDASIDVNVATLMYQALPVNSIAMKLRAKEGILSLSTFSAAIDEGAIAAQAQLDATKDIAQLTATASTVDIDLGYLSEKVADVENIGGLLDSNISANSFGETDVDLIENLNADIQADSPELRIIPINLIKSVCQAVAFAEQKSLEPREWAEYTDLTPLTLTASLKDQRATISTLTASVEKFNASATGEYDLKTGDFNVPFELKLDDFAADIEGCNFISDSWRKVALPLRCKGNVDDMGIDTCLPDKDSLKSLAKQRVKQEVDKQKDKLEEKAESLIKDKLGEQGSQLLRGLFN